MKNVQITILAAVLATTLVFSGFSLNNAHAQTGPYASKVAAYPTGTSNLHTLVFKVCAGDQMIRVPEVIVSSLAEIKTVQLSKSIDKGSCITTATQMAAFDPNNIKVKLVTTGTISKMVADAEKKLVSIKSQIAEKNDLINEIMSDSSQSAKVTNQQKVNKVAGDLADLRKQLKDARAEYYRLLYILNS